MIIKNALILDENFRFVNSDIEFSDKINKIEATIEGGEEFDANDCYVVPGFIDTHIHSCAGRSFMEATPDAYKVITDALAKHGTTGVCPTISTTPPDVMMNTMRGMADAINKGGCSSKLVGIHFEGPFIGGSTGALAPGLEVKPSIEAFEKYYEACGGHLKIMTIAPEVEGTAKVISHAAERGVKMSIGHTGADVDTAKRGFEYGITRATHLYNAMSGLHHRNPNVVGAVLASDNIEAELICDFFHIHPDVVKATYKLLGADRITVVTDAEVGAGMPDGTYMGSSGRYLTVRDGKTYTDDGIICGGTSFMLDCVKNLVSIGIPIENAVKMASYNPARAAGVDCETGSLALGKCADLLVLDKNLNLVKVFVDGREIV